MKTELTTLDYKKWIKLDNNLREWWQNSYMSVQEFILLNKNPLEDYIQRTIHGTIPT